jgi:hypothetical protein
MKFDEVFYQTAERRWLISSKVGMEGIAPCFSIQQLAAAFAKCAY